MQHLGKLVEHLSPLSQQPCGSSNALGVKRILFQGDSITDAGRSRDTTIEQPNLALGSGYAQMVSAILLSERPEEGLKIYNRGVGGDRIVNLYARMAVDGYVLKPEMMSVLVGVNDTCLNGARLNGVPLPKYERVYRDFLSEMASECPGLKFVLCEPFVLNCGNVAKSYSDWRAEIDQRRIIVRKLCEPSGTSHINPPVHLCRQPIHLYRQAVTMMGVAFVACSAKEFHAVLVDFQQMFDDACKRAPPEYWGPDGVHPSHAGHMLMAKTWLAAVTGAA